MRSLTLITKGLNTCTALMRQLNALIGDKVKIKGFHLDGGLPSRVADDLIVISSKNIMADVEPYLEPGAKVLIARRSLNYENIEALFEIPANTDVLLVNDLQSTALDTISVLKALGIDHLNYFPYYPGIADYPRLKTAVTPGEPDLVPKGVERVIDIKTRNIDVSTMVEILASLDLLDEKANLLSARFIKDIINLIKKTKRIADVNREMKYQLLTIINSVHDGIIAFDAAGKVSVLNHVVEQVLGVCPEELLGLRLEELPFKDLAAALENVSGDGEKLAVLNGRQFVVKSSAIKDGDVVTGTIFTLKDVTEIQRLETELRRKLRGQNHTARYTFDDIAGASTVIKEVKELALKLANSSSPILIQRESGTGKELFAQAIHNASPRKHGPFVAINFAALPESLLESELFGYDEGAFTGAKKGGKPGLFELAHGGTIFLDEIGDAPLSFQVRLLRVIQEKEIRRVGGSRVVPIDVRVIAASNKDLLSMTAEGRFRQDLYYRLNVLPLRIPPLRARPDDIMCLARLFYAEYFQHKPPMDPERFFEKVEPYFIAYHWPGNVRELQNVVEYLSNICPNQPPDYHQLPAALKATLLGPLERDKLSSEEKKALSVIAECNERKIPIGRRSLARHLGLSENRVRYIIEKLKRKGLVTVGRGVRGIEITERSFLQESDNPTMGGNGKKNGKDIFLPIFL